MMRSGERRSVGHAARLAVVTLATGLIASSGSAQNLDLEEMAALLVLPVITGDLSSRATTSVTITNAGGPVRLHINVLSGDPEDRWLAQDFDCLVTASETVLFSFEPSGSGSSVTYECSDAIALAALAAQNGVMVVAVEDPVTGQTLNVNQIFGDAVVIDFAGAAAYSVSAIAIQGVVPTAGSGDRRYRFDNQEYAAFPSALATNYLPSSSGSLVLFTLDGTSGSGAPPEAALSIKYSLGAQGTASTSHAFDCFDIVDLSTLVGSFGISGLGSRAGHMTLRPEPVTYSNLLHDSLFDGGAGNVVGVRTPPVHGWIFQTADGQPLANTAAFGRTLGQSQLPLVPSAGDVAVMNAR